MGYAISQNFAMARATTVRRMLLLPTAQPVMTAMPALRPIHARTELAWEGIQHRWRLAVWERARELELLVIRAAVRQEVRNLKPAMGSTTTATDK